jgi:uncharacterized protein
MGQAFQAADRAFKGGDFDGLRAALGDPPGFPDCTLPQSLGCGAHPLEYAIYWSPFEFVEQLLDAGANPNYHDPAGFPSLMAALSTERADKHALLALLLDRGADPKQRGNNDWTPLHYVVALRDLQALRILLAHGADPSLRTNVDDHSTPIEDAKTAGFIDAVALFEGMSRDGRGEAQ